MERQMTSASEESSHVTFMSKNNEESSFEEMKKEAGSLTLSIESITQLSRFLEGRLLTICDACISDKSQVKAVKDLVRDAVRSFRAHAEELGYGEGDPYSVGVATLDIEETEQGFKIPVLLP